MIEKNGRKYLYSLIPTDTTFRSMLFLVAYMGVAILGVFSSMDESRSHEFWKGYLFMVPFLVSLTALDIYIDKGYRVSYDDDAIYLRPNGIGWNLRYKADFVMRYDDIDDLFASGGNMNISPFEFVEIQRKGWDGEERFFLSRIFLRENQLKELLRFIHTKVPEKFPQDVIDYMNAEPGWIELKQIAASEREEWRSRL